MHLQRYFDYPVHLTSSHQQLLDLPATSAPAPRCMDLVWQALHGAQGMARQALRYLDCRPRQPSDTLEAPAAAHRPEPMMPPAQAERAAEEPPHSAPALPVSPAPLKSVLLPEVHGKRTQTVRFADAPSVRHIPPRNPLACTGAPGPQRQDSGPSLPPLLQDASCLDFSLLNTHTKDAATEGFKRAAQEQVLSLQSCLELWNNPRVNLDQRMEVLQDCKQRFQDLHKLVHGFKKALKTDPTSQTHADVAETSRTLANRLVELEQEVVHADKLIAQCKKALEAENNVSSESESSDAEDPLDFNGISRFAKGDTEVIVRSMYDPLVELATEYNELEEAVKDSPPGTFDWQLAAKNIVVNLDQMEDLLMDHVLAYGGRNREFVQWISDKSDALKQERLGWERKLARYSV